jgi:hypothetical protein
MYSTYCSVAYRTVLVPEIVSSGTGLVAQSLDDKGGGTFSNGTTSFTNCCCFGGEGGQGSGRTRINAARDPGQYQRYKGCINNPGPYVHQSSPFPVGLLVSQTPVEIHRWPACVAGECPTWASVLSQTHVMRKCPRCRRRRVPVNKLGLGSIVPS